MVSQTAPVLSGFSWEDVCVSGDFLARRQKMIAESLDRQETRAINKRQEFIKPSSEQISDNSMPSKPDQNKILINSGSPSKKVIVVEALDQFEIGIELSKITYREPNLMKEAGSMYGIAASYTHRKKNRDNDEGSQSIFSESAMPTMYRFYGKYSWGTLDYDSQGTGSASGIQDQMLETRILAGYDAAINSAAVLTPYAGFGYRMLYDDLRGQSTTGHYGYRRLSQYFYLPLGIENRFRINPTTRIALSMEYDKLFHGIQVSHLEDVDSDYETLTNAQTQGFGLRTHLNLSFESTTVDFFVQPFFRYWNINNSRVQPVVYQGVTAGYGLEPQNNSTEYGVQLGLKF